MKYKATKQASGKYKLTKVNPFAICHASVGPEKSERFERCVLDVKAKHGIKK